MEKKTIFDLYNEQHANDPIIKASDELPGIVKPEDVKPEVIPGEDKAAPRAATVETPIPAPAQPAAGGGEQAEASANNINKEGGQTE